MADDSKVSVKILIDTKKNRVLFAEAGKDFVDFLFNLLTLPIGTVMFLTKESMVSSLGTLYNSVENLGATYMQPNLNKDVLLKPKAPTIRATKVPLLQSVDHISVTKVYVCSSVGNCHSKYVTNNPKTVCPYGCGNYMSRETSWVGPKVPNVASGSEAGYVKEVVTYMVMDDLEVKPMSTISSITMLNKFNVKDVGALEERMVVITMVEGLKLLKASLQSKMVLSSVFLGNSAAI